MGGHQLWEGIINGRAWEGMGGQETKNYQNAPNNFYNFQNKKNKTKKLPLKIKKKTEISLKSQNVRKQTLPKYSH